MSTAFTTNQAPWVLCPSDVRKAPRQWCIIIRKLKNVILVIRRDQIYQHSVLCPPIKILLFPLNKTNLFWIFDAPVPSKWKKKLKHCQKSTWLTECCKSVYLSYKNQVAIELPKNDLPGIFCLYNSEFKFSCPLCVCMTNIKR